jgi:hypothetical protein
MNHSDTEDRALQALKEGALREQALKTCRHFGLTNQDLARLECGGESNQRLIRNTFDWLSKSNAMGFPALLEAMPMRLEGRKGRPLQAYRLTEFGRKVLYRLDPTIKIRVINPRDEKDLNHRFAQLDVLTRALQNGWQAEVEKVIPYAKGKEVRCDVFITQPDGTNIHVEIEQELTRNNIERAREKFRNWQAYALSKDIVPDLIFVFNLPDTKLASTLAIWQEALGCVSEAYDFSLDVRYILIGVLEGQSLENAVESFSVWMESIEPPEPDAGSGAASEVPGQTAAPEVWLPDASELLPEFERRVHVYSDARHPADRLTAFFEMMLCIYNASYRSNGSNNSDTYKYSELPVKSLWLLRRYLNLPQNLAMYAELKQAMIWVQGRSGMGLIMLRNTICGILWDTFLKHHKLAMGGALRVTLDVPDYVNHNSSFEVKVMFWDKTDIPGFETKRDEACKALAWVMTTFFWYPKILETGTQPWKKKNKKMKGTKQNNTDND